MKKELFRQKSIDKAKSPYNLNDYIRVTNPSVCLLIFSVIVLLVGACAWGIWGHVDSTVPTLVSVQNKEAVCYVAEEDISSVQSGMTVEYADNEAVITVIGDRHEEGYECALEAESYPDDGMYEGKIIIKRYKPITFVMN